MPHLNTQTHTLLLDQEFLLTHAACLRYHLFVIIVSAVFLTFKAECTVSDNELAFIK